jgi:DNA repair protein RadD
MIALRKYQLDAIDDLRTKIRIGCQRLVLISPCGSGKTCMFSHMIAKGVDKGSRSLVIVHRRELVDQTLDKLQQFGVQAGVLMGNDRRRDDWLPVQIASIQTLSRRLDRLPQAQFIILDECHRAMAPSYDKVLDHYPKAIIVGATATPFRTDKLGLKDKFQDCVIAATPAQLIEEGYLVNYEAFAYDSPDLHKIPIVAGDFEKNALGLACNTKILVGSVVREYAAHALGRRAIVFAVNIVHSERLRDEFLAAGIPAAHVDCDTPKQERTETLRNFAAGQIHVLVSVGIFTEGWDCPAAEVCILARPTKSIALWIQMLGRVLRPSPETGKRKALFHDHSGGFLRLGFVDDDRDYSLTATPERVVDAHTCPACFAIFSRTKLGHCPNCNELIAVPEERAERGIGGGHDKIEVEGKRISRDEIERIRGRRQELGLTRPLSDQQLARAVAATREQKAAEFLRLKEVAQRKGFKEGFVAHQFRGSFSHWPKFTDEELARVEPAARPFFPLEKERA